MTEGAKEENLMMQETLNRLYYVGAGCVDDALKMQNGMYVFHDFEQHSRRKYTGCVIATTDERVTVTRVTKAVGDDLFAFTVRPHPAKVKKLSSGKLFIPVLRMRIQPPFGATRTLGELRLLLEEADLVDSFFSEADKNLLGRVASLPDDFVIDMDDSDFAWGAEQSLETLDPTTGRKEIVGGLTAYMDPGIAMEYGMDAFVMQEQIKRDLSRESADPQVHITIDTASPSLLFKVETIVNHALMGSCQTITLYDLWLKGNAAYALDSYPVLPE